MDGRVCWVRRFNSKIKIYSLNLTEKRKLYDRITDKFGVKGTKKGGKLRRKYLFDTGKDQGPT